MLLSFYFWEERAAMKASIFGSLAMLTKIQALFLFPAFLLVLVEEKINFLIDANKNSKISIFLRLGTPRATASGGNPVESKKFGIENFLIIFIIPFTLFLLCLFYYFRVHDFWAILTAEKSVKLFFYFPFAQFNASGSWAGTAWLEDVVFYFMAMFILAASLFKAKERSWFYFTVTYSIFLIFIPQRDITRFSFPLLPLFLLHFEKFFTGKVFKIALIICLPAIYFYIINFMLINQAPIADWSKLLK